MDKSCSKINCGLKRSPCPITNILDLIGDKWTILVIRDMMFGKKKTFNEFLESPEGIATNILASRLKKLEAYGMIKKSAYSKSPRRYEYTLTKNGRDLRPILRELLRWAQKHIKGVIS